MKREKDATGLAFWSYFKGKQCEEIIEREDGYFDTSSGPKAYFVEYRDWSAHSKKAIKHAKGKVLDIGCGAGRVCLYLQKKGLDVVGIDNSPLAIKVCKKRGVKKASVMGIEGIGKFGKNAFDTIVLFGNNFGLFQNYKKAKKLLKTMHKITSSPNALIIAESLDYRKTDEPAHKLYQQWNKKRGKMPGQLKIRVRFGKCIGEWFEYLIVTKKEMKDILKGTGWKTKKFIDSQKREKGISVFSSKKSPMYIAIIEKTKK